MSHLQFATTPLTMIYAHFKSTCVTWHNGLSNQRCHLSAPLKKLQHIKKSSNHKHLNNKNSKFKNVQVVNR